MNDSKTVELLQSIAAAPSDPECASICGKFHAHLTVVVSPAELADCQEFCRTHRVKLTVVDLENTAGRQQTDVMVTCHFRDDDAGAIDRITEQLTDLTTRLQQAGWPVTRAKLEHESQPSFAPYTTERYHEVHVKLSMPASCYAADYARLITLGQRIGFVPSRNPLQRNDQAVTQFVNLRIYQGDQAAADRRVNDIVAELQAAEFSVTELKRETVVYDTARNLDAWWA